MKRRLTLFKPTEASREGFSIVFFFFLYLPQRTCRAPKTRNKERAYLYLGLGYAPTGLLRKSRVEPL